MTRKIIIAVTILVVITGLLFMAHEIDFIGILIGTPGIGF